MLRPITCMIRKTSLQIRLLTGLVLYPNQIQIPRKPYDVFINHRGVDTKEKEAGLVHDYLRGSGFHPFLDVQSLKTGEKFADEIDEAVRGCKVGISIFSPRYGESLSCLNELVLLMETGKPLLPIFCDMEPSELRVAEYRAKRCSAEQVKRFADALEEAKGIVGLRFKSATGNWSKLGRDTVEAVERIFIELGEECPRTQNPILSYPGWIYEMKGSPNPRENISESAGFGTNSANQTTNYTAGRTASEREKDLTESAKQTAQDLWGAAKETVVGTAENAKETIKESAARVECSMNVSKE